MTAPRRIKNGRTVGPSPKVVASVVTAVVSWLIARYGLELDDEDAAAISAVLLAVAGVVAPPGEVELRR
jgi:hypothetical protein